MSESAQPQGIRPQPLSAFAARGRRRHI